MACKITLVLAFALFAVASGQFLGDGGLGYGGVGYPGLGYYGGFDGGLAYDGADGGLGGHGHDHYPKYEFKYGVFDPKTKDNKQQYEIRDGDHVTSQYSSHLIHA